MGKVEALRLALAELGESAGPEDLAAFARARLGVEVSPPFVPVLKATLKAQERRDAFLRDRAAGRAADRAGDG